MNGIADTIGRVAAPLAVGVLMLVGVGGAGARRAHRRPTSCPGRSLVAETLWQ